MAKLTIEVVEVPRFQEDAAHYSVREAEIDRIRRILSRDPLAGDAVPDRPGLSSSPSARRS